ncbi:MAG: aquaporin [Crocinitomicaceae bacterium]|nr:aquaporin [Flavobacteriales bacterium]NQZ38183.1 aquaporin [Crocinitomicaceae bacterium]
MKKYLAEFIGTFALVFFGTGAVIVNEQTGGSLGLLGIATTFGISITAMVYIFGSISGTHINPAVTISLALGKLMPKNEVFGYIVAQILGGVFASSLLLMLFPSNQTLGCTIPSNGILQSFSLEFILTFFLMLTILGIGSKKENSNVAGLVIGLMVTGMILFAGPISGGSFNPARSIAPAIVSWNLTALWMYLLAPTLGAILAILVWRIVKNDDVKSD